MNSFHITGDTMRPNHALGLEARPPQPRRRSCRPSLLAAVALPALLAANSAAAQVRPEQDVPPVFKSVDDHGVDLVSRKLLLTLGSIEIGPGGPGSLGYNHVRTNATQREVFGYVTADSPSAGKY